MENPPMTTDLHQRETYQSLRGLQQENVTFTSGSAESDKVATQTIPVILLTVAACIILCSLAHCASDWRSRRLQRQHSYDNDHQHEGHAKKAKGKGGSFTTAAASHSQNGSYGSSKRQDIHRPDIQKHALEDSQHQKSFYQVVPRMLPPLPDEFHELETTLSPYQESLSRVSTLTNSIMEGSMSFEYQCEKAWDNDVSNQRKPTVTTNTLSSVTELSAFHRVSPEGAIGKLFIPPRDSQQSLLPATDQSKYETRDDRDNKVGTIVAAGKVEDKTDVAEEETREAQASSCSSTTGGGSNSVQTKEESELLGETCLGDDDVTPKKAANESISFRSLERSPDTRGSVGRDIAIVGRLLFGEGNDEDGDVAKCGQNIEGLLVPRETQVDFIPHQNMAAVCSPSSHEDQEPIAPFLSQNADGMPLEEYIRDIYFVPVQKKQGGEAQSRFSGSAQKHLHGNEDDGVVELLGIQLLGSSCALTHPTVADILPTSPLFNRLFEGDSILHVNDIDVEGFSSEAVVKLFARCRTEGSPSSQMSYQMIRLTVFSSQCDGFSDTSEEASESEMEMLDVGIRETEVEF